MERANANRTTAKAIKTPSTALNELMNWVSDEVDWDKGNSLTTGGKTASGSDSIATMI